MVTLDDRPLAAEAKDESSCRLGPPPRQMFRAGPVMRQVAPEEVCAEAAGEFGADVGGGWRDVSARRPFD